MKKSKKNKLKPSKANYEQKWTRELSRKGVQLSVQSVEDSFPKI